VAIEIYALRHGQSMGNAGHRTEIGSTVELTDLGRIQAEAIASSWDVEPDFIVVSSYLRTQKTADPTWKRFPAVDCEVWQIQEFSYLSAVRYANTTTQERRSKVIEFWTRGDASFRDDVGCESFSDLIARTQRCKAHLDYIFKMGAKRVFMFSHSQFLSVLQRQLLGTALSDPNEEMKAVWEQLERSQIPNGQGYIARFDGVSWTTEPYNPANRLIR
jgi:probable phosphoglycerate mutase